MVLATVVLMWKMAVLGVARGDVMDGSLVKVVMMCVVFKMNK